MANFVTLLSYLPKKIQVMKEINPNVKGVKKIILDPIYPETPSPPKKKKKKGIGTYTVLDKAVHNCIFFRFTGSTLLTWLMRDGRHKGDDED